MTKQQATAAPGQSLWGVAKWIIAAIVVLVVLVFLCNGASCVVGSRGNYPWDQKPAGTSAPAPVVAAPKATAEVSKPEVVASTPAVAAITATASCREGVVPGNQANFVGEKVPIGTAEGPTIIEVSWKPGNGYGGYNRAVIVLGQRDIGRNYVTISPATVRMNQYCGALDDVKNYAKDPTHHVRAMIDSSSDAGGRPQEDEIPVFALGKDGILTILKDAKSSPGLAWYQTKFAVYYQP